MKQADLNKLLNGVLRASAKSHHWSCSRGFLFKASDLLFFAIGITGLAKQRHLSYLLSYKLLAFDDLFWAITNLAENAKKPLSFRAAGVWTAPMTTISEDDCPIADWSRECLQPVVETIIAHCEGEVETLCREIRAPDDNLRVIERYYSTLLMSHPDAAINIWRERMLTHILKREYQQAETIIQDRRDANDDGGFMAGTQTLYQLAATFLRTLR